MCGLRCQWNTISQSPPLCTYLIHMYRLLLTMLTPLFEPTFSLSAIGCKKAFLHKRFSDTEVFSEVPTYLPPRFWGVQGKSPRQFSRKTQGCSSFSFSGSLSENSVNSFSLAGRFRVPQIQVEIHPPKSESNMNIVRNFWMMFDLVEHLESPQRNILDMLFFVVSFINT